MKRIINLFALLTLLALAFGALGTTPARAVSAPPAPRTSVLASGTLDTSDPTFNRPLSGTPPTTLYGSSIFRYDTASFSLACASDVTINFEAATGGSISPTNLDTYLFLYGPGGFNPASPLTNALIGDDDSGAGLLSQISATNLAAGSYTVVVSHFLSSPSNFPWTYSLGMTSVCSADNTDPIVSVPSSMTVEATSSSGAVVTFSATATDETAPANPSVTCIPSSGSTFAIGTTTVNCSATDTAGNTGTNSFDITVQDTTAPDTSIDSSPADPALTPDAVVTFSAIDAVSVASYDCSLDGSAFAACTSGTNFGPLADGSHTFQVRAKDNANNTDASPASYTWTTNVFDPAIFADVPFSHWANSWIETLYLAGITGGCDTDPHLLYCPDAPVTRAQMAIFILRGMYGSNYAPPAATGTVFADVPLGSFADSWIEQLAAEGITAGCGGSNYCPDDSITRAEMSIFLLRGEHGSAYIPPTATGTVFGDVAIGSFAADFIEQLFDEGITAGCGGGDYCPDSPVTRAEMAVFLVKTFNIP